MNGLHAPTKRHRLAEWIQKQHPYICCLQETNLRSRDTYRLKVRGWKKIFHVNGNQKKAGVPILISDKIVSKIKTVTRDKEGHQIMIKWLIQEENITVTNIYAPNIGATQYIRQMLTAIKGEIDSNTIILGNFNSPLTPRDRSSRQKRIKDKEKLLKATREKWQITYKGTPIRLTAEFSAETLQARREWHNIFKVMTYNQNYTTQQISHSDSMEKSKALQTSKS